MTTPPRTPPPSAGSPHFPAGWRGGIFDDPSEPGNSEWFLESWGPPEWAALMATWEPLEHLSEGDPPEVWGSIDLGGGGAGATPRQTEPRSGAVVRISASGLVLDDHDQWLNVSRFGPPVDLRAAHVGDVCVCEVELSREGRAYLRSLTVLPLDEKTHDAPETEHLEPEGSQR